VRRLQSQLSQRLGTLPSTLIEEWQGRYWPANPFDPLGPPPGTDPWLTLQSALRQYVRDLDNLRRGQLSRWQNHNQAGVPPRLRSGMLDRASQLATEHYSALGQQDQDLLRSNTACPGFDFTGPLFQEARSAWETQAANAGYPYLWDGSPRP
jgi:hypothetical protein